MLKRKSKRFLSIVLAAAMIIGLFPVAAFAEDSETTPSEDSVASVTDSSENVTYYSTLENAVEAVTKTDNKTGVVTLLKDTSGNGIGLFAADGDVNVNLTIDFNGFTYTCNGKAVGSGGTQSQAFHLEKDNTVVLENGTLTANTTDVNMLIQNYSDLTLENMNLDATQGTNSVGYVLSNNCGKVNIIGDTSITAKDGQTAFDVCYWPTSYPEGTQVTVNTTGTIKGNIELGTYGDIKENQKTSTCSLSIQEINLDGAITIPDSVDETVKSSIKENCEIVGGTFSDPSSVQEYIAPGNALDADGNVTVASNAEAQIAGFGYATLEDALEAATPGDTITLVNNVEMDSQINLPDNTTLDGAGYTLKYTGGSADALTNQGFLNILNDNVTIKNITIEAPYIKHGVQFYDTVGGTLDSVTINGAAWTSVLVNGSTGINIIDSVLNPADGAYANIEFSMGQNVNTIPSLTIDGVSFDSQYPAIWVDDDTVAAIKGRLGADADNDAVSDKITSNITNNNKSDITIVVEFVPGESENVIAESTYEPPYTGKYSYEIFTTVGDNGTIDVDRYATEGDEVTITVSPDEAYMLDEMTITSGGKDVEVTDNGDGTYTFTMPSGDVKIEVTFAEDPNWEEEPAMPFVDVNEGDWFHDVVLYAYENGLMTGTSADTFAPNTATTRGMIVSMLARLEGVTSAESAGFVDVADSDWYATAVNWAASEGIVNGFEDDTFRPNDVITREQMAAILYNYADYKGYDVSARADLSDYADAASISSWAEDVLSWANAEGLINGMTATTIDPQGATTRAQTAAMFERFLTAHAE